MRTRKNWQDAPLDRREHRVPGTLIRSESVRPGRLETPYQPSHSLRSILR